MITGDTGRVGRDTFQCVAWKEGSVWTEITMVTLEVD